MLVFNYMSIYRRYIPVDILIWSMYFYIFTENYCPLMSVRNAIVNARACRSDGCCQPGTVLEYSCTGDYTITTPVTVCLANSSWSHRPICLKHEDGRLRLCKYAHCPMFCPVIERKWVSI